MPNLKFYITRTTPDYTPTTYRGTWDAGASQSFVMAPTMSGTVTNEQSINMPAVADYDYRRMRLVSEPLGGGVVFSGTVSGVIGMTESNADLNAKMHLHIFVTQGATDSLRGTILEDYIDAEELSASSASAGQAFSATMSEVTAYEGDLIVVEIGMRGSAATTGYYFTIYTGGTSTEMVNGGAYTQTGWIEFPCTLSNRIAILPEASYEVSTLEAANKVFAIVEGSSPLVVGSATNTTIAPTYANSPRETVVLVKSGDAAFCNTVAAAQLSFLQNGRVRLNGVPIPLRYGLGIERGDMALITIPRAGISETLPVRRLQHDFKSNVTLIDVGEFAAPRDDAAALVEVAKSLSQLTKESKI